MRPISIAFECFGPYLERQFVDFSLLEKDGLFLICGETGAGKTTVLEAMSYALYGKSTGGIRGDLQEMRCELAPVNRKTEVEFIFECNGSVYRFYRSILPKVKKKKAKGNASDKIETDTDTVVTDEYDTVFESQKKTEDGWISTWEGSKKGQNANAAKDVIGLDYNQFCQIVILPQGKFETFLVSPSGDKEKILKSLFRTQRWENAAKKIVDLAEQEGKAAENLRAFVSGGLGKYECDSTQKLSEHLTTSEEMEGIAKEKADTAKILHAAKQEEVASAERIADDFAELEAKKEKLDKLLSMEEEKQEDARILEWAEKADSLKQAHDHFKAAQKEKEQKEKAYEEARKKVEAAEEKIQKAEADLKSHCAGTAEIEKKKETLDLYKGKRELYGSLATLSREVEETKGLLTSAKTEAERSVKDYDTAEKAFATAKEEREKAYEAWALAQERYLRGIGSVLALNKLKEGEPCPVCGSLHHPDPAKPAEDHVSDEQLKDYEEKRDKKLKKEQTALETLNKKRDEKEKKQGELTVAELNATGAQSRYTEAQTQCIPEISDSAKLEETIKTLSEEIEEFERKETALLREKATAEGEKNAAVLALETGEKEKAEAILFWEQVKTEWEAQCVEKGFADEAAYLTASMEPEKKNKLTKAYTEYLSDLKNAREAYEQKALEVEGKEKPNLKELKESLQTLLESYTVSNSAYTELKKSIDDMREDLARLQKVEQESREKEEKAERLKAFGKILRGSHGIGIQRYILGIMLSSVIQEANRILENVLDGRYTIYRTDEGRGRAGLELAVHTYGMKDEGRLARTLSGGEKFLVSLCLAIGLSAVIQAGGNGRVEALFVDEGFGSLDKDRIGDAVQILEHTRGKHGLVGIISHVESLVHTIPAKIRIRKDKNGSSLRIDV